MSLFLNILGGIAAVSGILGASKRARSAGRNEQALMQEALETLRQLRERTSDMYAAAKRYSPEVEEAHLASQATLQSQRAVGDALRSAAARFRSAGGDTSDSEFGVRATGIASRAQENLASMIASMRANTFAKKQDAIARAISLHPNPQGFLQAANHYGQERRAANQDMLNSIMSLISFGKGLNL